MKNRGLNPYIEDVARRIADAGFIGFAPDALTPLGGYPGNDDDGRAMQRERDVDEMTEDFIAAVKFAREHPDSNGRVGAVGFCFVEKWCCGLRCGCRISMPVSLFMADTRTVPRPRA